MIDELLDLPHWHELPHHLDKIFPPWRNGKIFLSGIHNREEIGALLFFIITRRHKLVYHSSMKPYSYEEIYQLIQNQLNLCRICLIDTFLLAIKYSTVMPMTETPLFDTLRQKLLAVSNIEILVEIIKYCEDSDILFINHETTEVNFLKVIEISDQIIRLFRTRNF